LGILSVAELSSQAWAKLLTYQQVAIPDQRVTRALRKEGHVIEEVAGSPGVYTLEKQAVATCGDCGISIGKDHSPRCKLSGMQVTPGHCPNYRPGLKN
jgi:hypothetical protein